MGCVLGSGTSPPVPSRTKKSEALLRYPQRKWQGWGCSLAWCGKALGSSPAAEAWADLLFTLGDVSVERFGMEPGKSSSASTIRGLGLNVVRYNVGGVGRFEDQTGEKRSGLSRGWYAEIDGFLPDKDSAYDWNRDEEQRRFLKLAVDRGADEVEFFSNSPMWWMNHSKSSFGGTLAAPEEFATYLAEVVAHARKEWHVPVKSISPFNEPSAGWWNFPKDQEGCNVPVAEQVHPIVKLRGELDSRRLNDVLIAVCEENTMASAVNTWQQLRESTAKGCAGRVNVHAYYNGVKPWLEASHPGVRASLRQLAEKDDLPVWMSEVGNGEIDGTVLAQMILEDLRHLRPTAWVYWQLIEHKCSWGVVEADFLSESVTPIVLPHAKYYVLAHFTRFFRVGCKMLNCTEPWAAAGYVEPALGNAGKVVGVLVNFDDVDHELTLSLPSFITRRTEADVVISCPSSGKFFMDSKVAVYSPTADGFEIRIQIPAHALCSVSVEDVALQQTSVLGITAAHLQGIANRAAKAAASERLRGETDIETEMCKTYLEHDLASACVSLGDSARNKVALLFDLVWSSAWVAVNHLMYGAEHAETERSRADLSSCKDRLSLDKVSLPSDLVEATSWATAHEHFSGSESQLFIDANAKAQNQLKMLGPDKVVLQALS